MALSLKKLWSGADFWDKEENRRQREQFARQAPKPAPQKPLWQQATQQVTNRLPIIGGATKAIRSYKPASNALDAVETGVARSLTGGVQGASGLYDLLTPGKGLNRVTQATQRMGAEQDQFVKKNNLNTALYKGGQLGGEIGQFVGPGLIVNAASKAGRVGKVIQAGRNIKNTPSVLPEATNALSKGARWLTKPSTIANVGTSTLQNSGYRTATGQDVSPGSVATDLGTSVAFGGALAGAGKLAQKVGSKLEKPKQFVINEGVPVEAPKQPLKIKAGVPLANNPLAKPKVGLKIVDNNPQPLKIVDNSSPRPVQGAARQSMLSKIKNSKLLQDEAGGYQGGTTATERIAAKNGVELKQPEVPVKTSSIDPNDPFGNKNLLTKIRNEAGSLVDDDAQMITLLKKIEKESGREGLVDQWMFDSGNVRASSSIANAKLKNSEDLSGALRGLSKQDLDEFDTYMAARAELKNYDGMPTSRTPEQNAAIVQAGDAKFGERFAYMNNFYKKQAQDMYDGGLITKEQLQAYQASDDYVRIQRDMEDLVNTNFGGSRSRSIGTTTAGQKRTGSQREVLSPTASAAKRTQQLQLEIQRNKAATNTIDVLEEAGLARKVSDTKNKNTISRIVEGKREVYEVPGDIKKVIDNVSPYQLGVIARVISAPTRLFRAGTTALSAPFTVTNYLRDQASSGLYSKSIIDTHNPKNIIQGLASAARDFAGESQHPLWKKFEEFSGDQTIFDELRNAQNTKRLLREIRRGEAGKVGNMVTQPIRTLEDLNSVTEKATRFQNFKGIYEKTLKATGNEQEAIKAAVLAARQNSVDFQRGSSFTRAVNLFIPYFNAGVQGSRNVARSFRDRPLSTTMKSVGYIAAPSVVLTAYNLSDPDRRAAYDSINEFEKEDNFIIVGPNPKQNEDGSWEGIYKIPKPQGYRELTDPVRDMSEAFMKGESVEDVAGMFKDMLGGLSGPVDITDSKKLLGGFIPQAAKPWIQLGMNQDLYTGNKIVPDFMSEETDDPTKRAFESTSGTARIIARQLGVSPIQVERAITDVTGSLGRYTINASDNVLANQGKIPQEQIGGRSIRDDFSRRLFEASGKLLDENKSPGRLYYEDVKAVTQGLNKNELAAFNSLHPSKTNFLGEDIFDENKRITAYTRAGAYLNNPGTLEADRKLDQMQRERGKPGNPMFDLPNPLLTKVLLKATLPPGSKDPELSNLYKEPWYQDYQNARSKYYDSLKSEMAKTGKSMPKSTNPYPETPKQLQSAMDAYSSLPKGTGARSNWIKANPGLWQQMTAQWAQVDAWENKERVAMGLAPIEDETTTSSGFGSGSGGGGGGRAASGYAGRSKVSVKGTVAKPTVKTKDPGKLKGSVKPVSTGKPKVGIKKSLV